MKMNDNLIAIYDFELFPYALGDVLTWNIRTAITCEECNKNNVDIYICIDEKYPVSIYQRELVNIDNFELFFTELHSAFGTHPRLGNLYIFRKRNMLIARLTEVHLDDVNLGVVNDYLKALNSKKETLYNKAFRILQKKVNAAVVLKNIYKRYTPSSLKKIMFKKFKKGESFNSYFKLIHSHEPINEFAARKGYIPLLKPGLGCAPDINEFIGSSFREKKIVTFHLRLRRLDAGYGANHSYSRDSDFLEWYDFLSDASSRHPEVQFITQCNKS